MIEIRSNTFCIAHSVASTGDAFENIPRLSRPAPSPTRRRLFTLAAVGALAPFRAVQAQSSVTIYGIVDMDLSKMNTGTTPTSRLNGLPPSKDTWTMKAGNTSRLTAFDFGIKHTF